MTSANATTARTLEQRRAEAQSRMAANHQFWLATGSEGGVAASRSGAPEPGLVTAAGYVLIAGGATSRQGISARLSTANDGGTV